MRRKAKAPKMCLFLMRLQWAADHQTKNPQTFLWKWSRHKNLMLKIFAQYCTVEYCSFGNRQATTFSSGLHGKLISCLPTHISWHTLPRSWSPTSSLPVLKSILSAITFNTCSCLALCHIHAALLPESWGLMSNAVMAFPSGPVSYEMRRNDWNEEVKCIFIDVLLCDAISCDVVLYRFLMFE